MYSLRSRSRKKTKSRDILRIGLNTIAFMSVVISHSAWLRAHPPEFSSKRQQRGNNADTGYQKTGADDETDRQEAYFHFEFLSNLALECPQRNPATCNPTGTRRTSFATQAPQALPLQKLLDDRASLRAKLRALHTVIECKWSTDGIAVGSDLQPIGVARGLARCVILEIQNSDQEHAEISVSVADKKQNSVPWTVLPSKSQCFLVRLNADAPTARIEIKTSMYHTK